MRVNAFIRTALVVAISGTLVACGGGGGGSGSDSPATTPLKLDPGNYAGSPVAVRQSADFDAASRAYTAALGMQSWLEDVAYLIGEYNAGWNYGEVTPEHCLEENGNLVIRTRFSDTREFVEYRFENCLVAGYGEPLRLSGRYVYDGTFNPAAASTRFEITETIDIRGSLGVEQQPLAIVGTTFAEGTVRDSRNYSFVLSSPALEYLIGDDYLALQEVRIGTSEKGDQYSLDMQSKLISSTMGGYLNLSTPVVIEEREGEPCPDKGHMVVSGDGTVEARYGESSGRGHGLEILLNGSEVEYRDTCYVDFGKIGV